MNDIIPKGLLRKFVLSFTLLIFFTVQIFSQALKTPNYVLETGGIAGTGRQTPFWLLSNQFGKNSIQPYSGFISAGFYSLPDTGRNFAIGYGLELFDREDGINKFWVHQAYLKIKYQFLILRVGSEEDCYGNQDSSLSSGSIMWSRNTRPIPKIVISTNGYVDVPFTKGYMQFNGLLAHGWFGDDGYVKNTYLHHKFVYVKVGGKLPVNFSMGLQHYAMWGGLSPDPGIGQLPSDFNAYTKVFFAKHPGTQDPSLPLSEALNKLGNHLGSWNYAIDLKLEKYIAGLYYQTIFEDYSGYSKWIMRDGLWGIYVKTRNARKLIHAFTYEYLHTSYQSGPPAIISSQYTRGNDNFFNNGIYQSGWTYDGFTIGTPLISSPAIIEGDAISITNNRVIAHHFGLEGGISEVLKYRMLFTTSTNYMNYPPFGQPYPKPLPVQSIFLELTKPIQKFKGLEIGAQLALDHGELYGNNGGIMIMLRKSGKIFGK